MEDSGYMARVAYVMEGVMSRLPALGSSTHFAELGERFRMEPKQAEMAYYYVLRKLICNDFCQQVN